LPGNGPQTALRREALHRAGVGLRPARVHPGWQPIDSGGLAGVPGCL